MDSLDGCIFGWTLIPHFENLYGIQAIGHHTGLILKWNKYDIWGTIIAHYGADGIPIVIVETLRDAVTRSGTDSIYINTMYKAIFKETPYFIDDGIHLGRELQEYQESHPKYDIWTCNCQHFVRHFVGDIPIESDIRPFLEKAISQAIRCLMFGKKDKVSQIFTEILDLYDIYRTRGICDWNQDLNIHVDNT